MWRHADRPPLSPASGGVLRAAGRQALGAALNLGSYWGVGLPTAYLLAVKAGLELRGLWGGLVTCTTLQARGHSEGLLLGVSGRVYGRGGMPVSERRAARP